MTDTGNVLVKLPDTTGGYTYHDGKLISKSVRYNPDMCKVQIRDKTYFLPKSDIVMADQTTADDTVDALTAKRDALRGEIAELTLDKDRATLLGHETIGPLLKCIAHNTAYQVSHKGVTKINGAIRVVVSRDDDGKVSAKVAYSGHHQKDVYETMELALIRFEYHVQEALKISVTDSVSRIKTAATTLRAAHDIWPDRGYDKHANVICNAVVERKLQEIEDQIGELIEKAKELKRSIVSDTDASTSDSNATDPVQPNKQPNKRSPKAAWNDYLTLTEDDWDDD